MQKKRTFMSDQISKMKKMNFRFGPDLRNEKKWKENEKKNINIF